MRPRIRVLGQPAREGAASRSTHAIAAAASLSLFAAALPARADPPKDPEALFDEGHKLMMEPGRLAEGCRLLAESYKLAEQGHTLLNLAECHRLLGKTATAWAEFDKAMQVSQKVGFTAAMQTAKQRRDELAAKLSTLTVTVPAATAELSGLAVEVNGAPWPREQWNKPVNVDPGPAEITAVAKEHKRFVSRVEIAADKDQKTVTVTLEREPSPEPASPPPASPPPASPPPASPPPPKPVVVVVASRRPIWPWIVGGAGLGLVGASIAFAVDQHAAGRELDDRCGTGRKACPVGFDFGPARGRELRGFGLFVGLGAAGLIAVGAGGLGLGLGARRGSTAKTSIQIGPTSVMLEGGF